VKFIDLFACKEPSVGGSIVESDVGIAIAWSLENDAAKIAKGVRNFFEFMFTSPSIKLSARLA